MPRSPFQICPGPSLAGLTTMGLGGKVIAEVKVVDWHALEKLAPVLESLGGEVRVLGGGSNILASDADLPLVLLRQERGALDDLVVKEDEETLLTAKGSVKLPVLLHSAAKLGLSGLEGLAGIPGTVGGAVWMNAGSYGVSAADVLDRVLVYSPARGIEEISAKEIQFSYRSCVLPRIQEWCLILEATFRLKLGKPEAIKAQMQEHLAQKKKTQPVTARSAGCVFKNPEPTVSAGRLLDQAGFRGKKLGGMEFSSLHANFLINSGNGSFAAAEDLIAQAKEAIQMRFGYDLQLEVRIWQ